MPDAIGKRVGVSRGNCRLARSSRLRSVKPPRAPRTQASRHQATRRSTESVRRRMRFRARPRVACMSRMTSVAWPWRMAGNANQRPSGLHSPADARLQAIETCARRGSGEFAHDVAGGRSPRNSRAKSDRVRKNTAYRPSGLTAGPSACGRTLLARPFSVGPDGPPSPPFAAMAVARHSANNRVELEASRVAHPVARLTLLAGLQGCARPWSPKRRARYAQNACPYWYGTADVRHRVGAEATAR